MRVIANLFQQLLDAENLEDELVRGELFEDVPLAERGDHRAVEAFPRHVVQTLTIGDGLNWYLRLPWLGKGAQKSLKVLYFTKLPSAVWYLYLVVFILIFLGFLV